MTVRSCRWMWAGALLLGLALAPAWAATAPPRAPMPVSAESTPQHISLEQAVAQVQAKTHGRVLRAGQRQFGHMIEYRIKVLTPDGHVRVVSVRTPLAKNSSHKAKETR